mmetsp:Transcript_34043/g.96451  ORF Transcript_34043/g.96451 Transcript_34043/m.96451 type:complete len:318 (-) Transcript_34043:836-1789(-)
MPQLIKNKHLTHISTNTMYNKIQLRSVIRQVPDNRSIMKHGCAPARGQRPSLYTNPAGRLAPGPTIQTQSGHVLAASSALTRGKTLLKKQKPRRSTTLGPTQTKGVGRDSCVLCCTGFALTRHGCLCNRSPSAEFLLLGESQGIRDARLNEEVRHVLSPAAVVPCLVRLIRGLERLVLADGHLGLKGQRLASAGAFGAAQRDELLLCHGLQDLDLRVEAVDSIVRVPVHVVLVGRRSLERRETHAVHSHATAELEGPHDNGHAGGGREVVEVLPAILPGMAGLVGVQRVEGVLPKLRMEHRHLHILPHLPAQHFCHV